MNKYTLMKYTLPVLAFAGKVNAVATTYAGTYDSDSIANAITSLIAGLMVGLDAKSVVIGGTIATVISLTLLLSLLWLAFGSVEKMLEFVKRLRGNK